ncbi:MAG: NfeD family protein [Sphingobium sp.]
MIEQLVENPWWWLMLAVLFGIGEIVTPGVFLIWIAAAAAITGVLAMLLPLPLAVQFVIFAFLCLGSVWLGRRWYADSPVASQDPLLNDRVARLIGETATLAEPIQHGRGRVRVGDSVWDCAGPDLAAGSAVRIVGARGSVLTVESFS